MGEYKADKYGMTAKELSNQSKRFYKLDGHYNWEGVDSFLRWCGENGYQKGIKLRRYDPSKPHSPENSYFGINTRAQIRENSEKFHALRQNSSPFCKGCKRVCPRNRTGGCIEWADYFRNNWDQNIHVPDPKPEPVENTNTPMVFRYEHPDLVREGIVFHG